MNPSSYNMTIQGPTEGRETVAVKAEMDLVPEVFRGNRPFFPVMNRSAQRPARISAGEVADFCPPVVAPTSAGLLHSYLIDRNDERRVALHRQLTIRPNMVVRTYRTCAGFGEAADELDEGCVILVDDGKREDSAAFIRDLCQSRRFVCVLLIEQHAIRSAIEAMKAGATDCLLYPCEADEILASVDEAQTLVRQLSSENAAQAGARRAIERLTARERDVLHGLLHGKSNKMIAIDLRISPRTVEIYRAHLMEKLDTHSLSETLKIAFAAGLS